MAAVKVSARQGEIWFDGMRFGGEAIKFPHGLLTAEQIEAMRAEDSGLIVEDWTDAPLELQAPEVAEQARAARRAKPKKAEAEEPPAAEEAPTEEAPK